MADTVKPLFIYFRHTPKGIKFICSYDTTPRGEAKRLIQKNDPAAHIAGHALNIILATIKQRGGFNSRARPDFAEIVKYVTAGVQEHGEHITRGVLHPNMVELMSNRRYSHIMHLPGDSRMSERIMFVPKKLAE